MIKILRDALISLSELIDTRLDLMILKRDINVPLNRIYMDIEDEQEKGTL